MYLDLYKDPFQIRVLKESQLPAVFCYSLLLSQMLPDNVGFYVTQTILLTYHGNKNVSIFIDFSRMNSMPAVSANSPVLLHIKTFRALYLNGIFFKLSNSIWVCFIPILNSQIIFSVQWLCKAEIVYWSCISILR